METYSSMSAERKNIPKESPEGYRYTKDDLDSIYKLPNITRSHPGGDCFVFRKDIFSPDEINLKDLMVGSVFWDGLFKLLLEQKNKKGHKYFRDRSRQMTWHQGTDWGWEITTPSSCVKNCWNLIQVTLFLFCYVT